MPDVEDRTLHGLLAGIGSVAVAIGVITQRFGAEATLGALMMTVGLAGIHRYAHSPKARVVRTTPSHRA
jgi:hypothetical protein